MSIRTPHQSKIESLINQAYAEVSAALDALHAAERNLKSAQQWLDECRALKARIEAQTPCYP